MTPQEAMQKHNLEIKSEFVPFSKSRNKDNKDKSLNWRVTLTRNGKDVLTTDYSAGIAHCPSYQEDKGTIYQENRVKTECEKGFKCAKNSEFTVDHNSPILPEPLDVLNNLILDASVLNSNNYEEWADECGYDRDSRKGEAIYRMCLEIALKLRNSLGEAVLAELAEAFQEY